MNKYEKYKDSGFDWIGEIPEHWKAKKLKYLAFANPSNIDKKSKKEEQEVFLCNYVDVYKNDFIRSGMKFMKATASDSQIEKFILKKGDVIATKDSETPDDIGVPALVIEDFNDVVCGYHLTHIKPFDINGDFLFRFFQTQYLKSYFEVSANGVTRYGLGVDKINSAFVIEPSYKEQTAIANYLDCKTAEIDELINQKEQLLELYEEEKTAIINQAVTKGINPDAPMKDSGIDWLGEIPEHWELKRVATFGSFSKGKGIPRSELKDDGYPAILYGDIYTKYNVKAEIIQNHINEETTKTSVEIKKGDLLFTGSGETAEDIGKCITYLGDETVYAGGDVIILRQKKHNSLFLSYSLNSNASIYQKASMAKGQIIIHIYASNLREIVLPIPNNEEQTAIVQHIETEISRINTKVQKTKKLIDLLGEYKQSLISEVVTGKVKVI